MKGIALLGAGIFATEGTWVISTVVYAHTQSPVADHGTTEHLPSLKRLNANLKAVYSRSMASAEKLHTAAGQLGFSSGSISIYSDETKAANEGLEDLLKRPDIVAVIVVLPISVQPDICRKALAAGKHVLVEKPIAKDVASALALVTEYRDNFLPKGLVLSVAEQFRYMAINELARKWVAEDKLLGELQQVHFRLWRDQKPSGKYYETSWRKDPVHLGGFILDGGVHHIALLRYVTGQDIVETLGFASLFHKHLPPTDTVNAAVRFRDGATGTLSMSFASAELAHDISFLGSHGSLKMMPAESRVTLMNREQKIVKEEIVGSNGIDSEVKAFLIAIETGKGEPRAGPIEALNDVAVIESLCSGGGKVKNWES